MIDSEDVICFSDSDDDLVGTTQFPDTIKTVNYSVYKPNNYHKNKDKFELKNITKSEYTSSDPTQNNFNRYKRMREIVNVKGFIVNVHDATNFDVDLDISLDLHEKYQDVISNQYTYRDLNPNFLKNPNMENVSQIEPKIGTTYRCRLRGVGINQLEAGTHIWKLNQICIDVKQLIDRTDGWVICTLSDIDVYQRLLVDITVDTCLGPIDVKDYLLNKMIGDDTPIFYPYSGKRTEKSSTATNTYKRNRNIS